MKTALIWLVRLFPEIADRACPDSEAAFKAAIDRLEVKWNTQDEVF